MGESIARFLSIACCAFFFAIPTSDCYCQTIVLRDLQLLESTNLSRMSIEGITMEDGRTWSWDQIQEGEVSPDLQVEFDRWRTEIGEPLFRVRLRLANRDYASLQPHADDLARRAGQPDSNNTVYYLACCAQVRSFLYQKQREPALLPLFELLRLRKTANRYHEIEELSSLHFSGDGTCDELLPVWFDAKAAGHQLVQFRQSDFFSKANSDGVAQVYLNTLAIAAGEPTIPFDTTPADNLWRSLYSAQSALLAGNNEQVARDLDVDLFRVSAGTHAIALYYLGTAQSHLQTLSGESNIDSNRVLWMLTLLKIPALYDDRFIELSAAAVSAVVNHPDSAGQVDFEHLRSELAGRYRQTTFGTTRK